MTKDIFKDKILLITGGTGSFGNAVTKRFLNTGIKEIRIVSRDEKKQDDMRHLYQAKYPDTYSKLKNDAAALYHTGSASEKIQVLTLCEAIKWLRLT